MTGWLKGSGPINLSQSESAAFRLLFKSKETDIVALAKEAGCDTRTFFENGNWSGVDFRGADVANVSFRNANLTNAIFTAEQFSHVKLSNPRSVDGVRVEHVAPEQEECRSIVQVSKPVDPLKARRDFLLELRRLERVHAENDPGKFEALKPLFDRLDPPLGQIWALELLLNATESWDELKKFGFVMCDRKVHEVAGYIGWNTPLRYLHLLDLATDKARLDFILSQASSGDEIHFGIIEAYISNSSSVVALEGVIQGQVPLDGTKISRLILASAQKHVKSTSSAIAFTRLLSQSGIGVTAGTFRVLVESCNDLVECRELTSAIKPGQAHFDTKTVDKIAASGLRKFNTLSRVRDAASAKRLENSLLAAKLKSAAGSEAISYSDSVEAIFDFLKEFCPKLIEYGYHAVAKSTMRVKDMEDLVRLARTNGLHVSSALFSSFAARAKSFDDFLKLISFMMNLEVVPASGLFENFLAKRFSVSEIKKALETMRAFGTHPNKRIRRMVIRRLNEVHHAEVILPLVFVPGRSLSKFEEAGIRKLIRTNDDATGIKKLLDALDVSVEDGVLKPPSE